MTIEQMKALIELSEARERYDRALAYAVALECSDMAIANAAGLSRQTIWRKRTNRSQSKKGRG